MKKEKPYQIPSHVTETILDSISDGVFTVDHAWRITSFNRAAERITRIPREEALGKHCWEVFRSNMCETDCALRRTMKQGKAFVDTATYIVDSEKRRIPVVVSTSLLKDEKNTVLGGVETFRDMSVVEELRRELDARYQVGDMVSRSPAMHRVFQNPAPGGGKRQYRVDPGGNRHRQGTSGQGPPRIEPPAVINPLWPSTAAPCRTPFWNRSFSGIRPGLSPTPSKISRDISPWPKGASSCWTRSATSVLPFR